MQITRREALQAIGSLFLSPFALAQAQRPNRVNENQEFSLLPPPLKIFYLVRSETTGKFSLEVEKDETSLKAKLKRIGIKEDDLEKTAQDMKLLANKFNERVQNLEHEIKEVGALSNSILLTPRREDVVVSGKDFKELATADGTVFPLKLLKNTSLLARHGHPTIMFALDKMEFNPNSVQIRDYIDPIAKLRKEGIYFNTIEFGRKNGILVDVSDLPLVIITDKKAFFIGAEGTKQNKYKPENLPQPKKENKRINKGSGKTMVAWRETI